MGNVAFGSPGPQSHLLEGRFLGVINLGFGIPFFASEIQRPQLVLAAGIANTSQPQVSLSAPLPDIDMRRILDFGFECRRILVSHGLIAPDSAVPADVQLETFTNAAVLQECQRK